MQVTGISQLWEKHHIVARIPVYVHYIGQDRVHQYSSVSWMDANLRSTGQVIAVNMNIQGEGEINVEFKKKFICTHVGNYRCFFIRTRSNDMEVNEALWELD